METKEELAIVLPEERIVNKIYILRGKKVMLDRDLAELYKVSTKVLNQAVKRSIKRFPSDFMFQLSLEEMQIWKSQIVTSKGDLMGLRKLPYAFTEQGVAMLSSVLKSERAILVNIQIIRTFTQIRQFIFSYKNLKNKIDSLEKKYDKNFKIVFDAIKRMMIEEEKPKEIMGFHLREEDTDDK